MSRIAAILAVLYACLSVATRLDAADTDAIIKQIDNHFSKVPPEFNRYRKLTLFGETVSGTKPPQAAIDDEIRLFEIVKDAELLKDPPEQVFWLCQNLLIFAPKTGHAFLAELINRATTFEANRYCSVLCLAAGAAGERLVLTRLKSGDPASRKLWSGYLSRGAVLDESVEPIIKLLESEEDVQVTASLLRALGMLNGPSSSKVLKERARSATSDEIQSAAIFALVEADGFGGISFLEGLKAVGPMAEKEKADGLKYLKDQTSDESPNGFEVGNDPEFVALFGDLRKSPVIAWLDKKGLLEDEALKKPKKLTPADKDELLDLLIDSKGFGLEAIKGSLFLSVVAGDVERLITLRGAAWYSPNSYSNSRMKTVSILIRHARRS